MRSGAAQMVFWTCLGCLLGVSPVAPSSAADIFYYEDADGTVKYASQALDERYRPLQAEIPPAAVPLSSATATVRQSPLETTIARLAAQHGVDAGLVRAIVAIESNFNPHALSNKGAVGAMQLMPSTAARYGVTNRRDPAQNIDAGIRHLKRLLARYQGNVALALAAYNAGENAVSRHSERIPPYRETMLYVPSVLAKWRTSAEPPSH